MSNLRTACGPVKSFVQPSLGFCCISTLAYILTTCPYFIWSYIWHLWWRWSSLPLYHVCAPCWEISICPRTPRCKTFH